MICGLPADGNLAKAYAHTALGLPVFGDLRRCNGVEWKRGPVVERFPGWRWNGAEWNRLESAKSGPFFSRCVGGSGFRRLIGSPGVRVCVQLPNDYQAHAGQTVSNDSLTTDNPSWLNRYRYPWQMSPFLSIGKPIPAFSRNSTKLFANFSFGMTG